jgi:hypothetical protein
MLFTAVWLRTPFLWGVMLCHQVTGSQHFKGTWSLSTLTSRPLKRKAVLCSFEMDLLTPEDDSSMFLLKTDL